MSFFLASCRIHGVEPLSQRLHKQLRHECAIPGFGYLPEKPKSRQTRRRERRQRVKLESRIQKSWRRVDPYPEKYEILEQQNGIENYMERFQKGLSDLSKYAGIPINDDLMVEIEGIAALFITLQGCQDYVSMSAAIFLYVRKFCSQSLTASILEYLKEMFVEPQSGDEDAVLKDKDWIQMMRECRDNWEMVRNNKFFSHISKLLGLVVTLGMCKAADITFEVKGMKMFEPDLKVVHGTALDFLDAAFSTTVFFVENIAVCWKEKSLKPLFINDKSAVEIDDEYQNVTLWWELVKNGNLKKVADLSEQEFDRRLEALTQRLRNLTNTKTQTFELKLIRDKLTKLLQIRNDYTTMKISSGIRRAPFCIEFAGKSSQGKTTCAEQIVDALLTSAGQPTSKDYQASYNASDKFMSTWSTDKLVLTIDDMANDKSQFVERPPTRVIIDVANNQPFYANVAFEGKGKIFVEPAICVVTTNKKSLDAQVYSNCPYSIQRRMHAVITVEAKPKFQYIVDGQPQGIDPMKVAAHYEETGCEPVFDDLWELTIERAVQPEELTRLATYKPVTFRGKEMAKVSFKEAVQYLISEYQMHLKSQDGIVERMKGRRHKIERCGCQYVEGGITKTCVQIKGYCDLHDGMEPHFGKEIVESVNRSGNIVLNRLQRDLFGLDTAVEGACTLALITGAKRFARHWDWISCVPTPWIKNSTFQDLAMLASQKRLKRNYVVKTMGLWTSIFGSLYCGYRYLPGSVCGKTMKVALGSFGLGFGLVLQRGMVENVKNAFRGELLQRNTISPALKDFRDEYAGRICTACAAVGVIYGIAKVYKAWREFQTHGTLEPKTQQEIDERDSEKNVWTEVVQRSLPVNPESANTTPDQLRHLIEKNLMYVSVCTPGKTQMANALFLKSNVVVLPDHYFCEEVLDCTFYKEEPDKAGGKFAARLSEAQSYLIPNTDLRICYCSSGGSFKDLTKFICEEELPEHQFGTMWRSKLGRVTHAEGVMAPRTVNHGTEFRGYKYSSLTMNTFRGQCGAPCYSKRRAIISGIHLGGFSGTPTGIAGQFIRGQVDDAIEELRKKEGVILSGIAGKFEKQVLGVNILTNKPLHPKSPLNYMPKESQVEYFGSCPGMTTFVSDVKPTLISPIVTDVTGEPNIYGPPVQHPQYFGFQTALSNLAVPADPFNPEILIMAIKDYKEPLMDIFKSELWCHARPLTDHENLNGIPGKKFMDAIKLNTSIGFPLGGAKRNFIIEDPPTPDKPCNRRFTKEIMDEIYRCLECYKRGERAYTIAKACKKDEILSKKKCRIFYGNGVALTWIIRRYFLPILRVLQMNPIVSECAVGVNSHGPEWQQLHERIFEHGKDRLIGGDYGKYDQKMPSQTIFAALRILIDFARVCDYSEEDLRVMEALTGDIVFALIAFNGDLIGLTEGTHISGNSLTVVINGIVGSLNMRCYFYTKHLAPSFEERAPFRDHVALMTYGDDNIGSVKEGVDFNIIGASQFLAHHGQIYTMPDKESELTEFLPYSEFEFLKRKSVWHPDLGVHVGALVEKSTIKMLHCYLRPKNAPLTEEHACGQNIDTALREWFNCGKEKYEERRAQMKEIARRAEITHLCKELDMTYEDRIAAWKEKYLKGYEMFNNPDGFEN